MKAAPSNFEELFRSGTPQRDKFLSRLFGVFSEAVVREWCACPQSPYEDLGRPTLRPVATPGVRHTLDFTLRSRVDGESFIAELKCELEYEGYKYLRLVRPQQLEHHKGNAFRAFLAYAENPFTADVTVTGIQSSGPVGAVLIWGAVTDEGIAATREAFGFKDVLSVEGMVADLQRWESDAWRGHVAGLRGWAGELFDYLA